MEAFEKWDKDYIQKHPEHKHIFIGVSQKVRAIIWRAALEWALENTTNVDLDRGAGCLPDAEEIIFVDIIREELVEK